MRNLLTLARWQLVAAAFGSLLLGGGVAFAMNARVANSTDARAVVLEGDCTRRQIEDRRCGVTVDYEGERYRLAARTDHRNGDVIDIVLDSEGNPDKVGTVAGQRFQALAFAALGVVGLVFFLVLAIVKR